MRKRPGAIGEIEPVEHGPAGWIQTVATNFFPWKFLPFENERSQPGDQKANETDKKIPGAGNIQTLADTERLQAMDAGDAMERLLREIRRIERQQQPSQGPRTDGDPMIRDW